jgi:hypothetical protein
MYKEMLMYMERMKLKSRCCKGAIRISKMTLSITTMTLYRVSCGITLDL